MRKAATDSRWCTASRPPQRQGADVVPSLPWPRGGRTSARAEPRVGEPQGEGRPLGSPPPNPSPSCRARLRHDGEENPRTDLGIRCMERLEIPEAQIKALAFDHPAPSRHRRRADGAWSPFLERLRRRARQLRHLVATARTSRSFIIDALIDRGHACAHRHFNHAVSHAMDPLQEHVLPGEVRWRYRDRRR